MLSPEAALSDTAVKHFAEKIQAPDTGLYYDKAIGAFLITPLEERTTTFALLKYPEAYLLQLNKKRDAILNTVAEVSFKVLLEEHDARALVIVAEELLKRRGKSTEPTWFAKAYTDIIALLTGLSVGVPSDKQVILHNLDNDFGYTARLNYAIYWRNHYKDYHWNPDKGIFENTRQIVAGFPPEQSLYEQAKGADADSALSAIIRLTEADRDIIVKLNEECDAGDLLIRRFDDLPLITELTHYCRSTGIDYKGSPELQQALAFLRDGKTSFSEAYKLENDLIGTLTPENITAIEYWGWIYEKYWSGCYSIGRILDQFYSLNWQQITSNKKLLSLCLKKASLFQGITRLRYLCKFEHADDQTLATLRLLDRETDDKDIRNSIHQILTGSFWREAKENEDRMAARIAESRSVQRNGWPDDMNVAPVIPRFRSSLWLTAHSVKSRKVKAEKIILTTQLATYKQLPVALEYLSRFTTDYGYHNRLIREHFGLTIDYLRTKNDLDTFLQHFQTMNEEELYQFYLKKAGINIWDTTGQLSYDNVYRVLKYSLTYPLFGGGGGYRGIGMFAVARLLELRYNTRLGLPAKNIHQHDVSYISFESDRRRLWMAYLRDHHLVTVPDREPPSFFDYCP